MSTEVSVPDGFDDVQSAPAPIDYFADIPSGDNQEPATLERLSLMAKRAVELEGELAMINGQLAEREEELNGIRRRHIPDTMVRLGMDSFKLDDGSTVGVDVKISANITVANKAAAFAWLREHNFDGLIKTKVGADFGKGESSMADAAVKALRDAGFEPSVDESVHPMTLKSFVKERLEEGEELPLDTFGVHEFKEARIKLPKTRKAK